MHFTCRPVNHIYLRFNFNNLQAYFPPKPNHPPLAFDDEPSPDDEEEVDPDENVVEVSMLKSPLSLVPEGSSKEKFSGNDVDAAGGEVGPELGIIKPPAVGGAVGLH